MLTSFYNVMIQSLGIDTFSFSDLIHMSIRAFVIYFLGIGLARLNKKMLGIRTPFNFIIFVMLGAIFANAIIHEHAFLPIVITVLLLMLLNHALAMLSFHFNSFESLLKGNSSVLVRNGNIEWKAMKENLITERELLNELKSQFHTTSLEGIETATLESDGTINFIKQR